MTELLTIKEMTQIFGCSKSSIWDKSNVVPDFPKPHKFPGHMTRWRKDEVIAFIDKYTGAVSVRI
jgi:predicted DNA-binding transcriptional regulator AlpA